MVVPSEHNSVVTTSLLAGLKSAAERGARGVIKLFDLFNYISEKVSTLIRGYATSTLHGRQSRGEFRCRV